MEPFRVIENKAFVGREWELNWLHDIAAQSDARILIVYGRRRVGKTALLEQAFSNRNLLKFEGRESLSPKEQMQFVMKQLATYAQEPLLGRIVAEDWVEVLKEIALKVK